MRSQTKTWNWSPNPFLPLLVKKHYYNFSLWSPLHKIYLFYNHQELFPAPSVWFCLGQQQRRWLQVPWFGFWDPFLVQKNPAENTKLGWNLVLGKLLDTIHACVGLRLGSAQQFSPGYSLWISPRCSSFPECPAAVSLWLLQAGLSPPHTARLFWNPSAAGIPFCWSTQNESVIYWCHHDKTKPGLIPVLNSSQNTGESAVKTSAWAVWVLGTSALPVRNERSSSRLKTKWNSEGKQTVPWYAKMVSKLSKGALWD